MTELPAIMTNYKLIDDAYNKICDVEMGALPIEMIAPYLDLVQRLNSFNGAYLRNAVPREQYPALARETMEKKLGVLKCL